MLTRAQRRQLVESDANDLYHRRIKYVALPVLSVYVVHALWACTKVLARGSPGGDGVKMSIGGDGLKMNLTAPFPPWMLAAHSIGACVLVALTLVQKGMAAQWLVEVPAAALRHRRLGYMILVALAVMDSAGYAMGSGYSAFPGFATFAKFFAAPFALWLVGIWLTARAGWLHAHALLGNMLLKGCIATPLSRLGGAALQRCGWSTAAGYYQGIGAVTCVIGAWQLGDLVAFVRDRDGSRKRDA